MVLFSEKLLFLIIVEIASSQVNTNVLQLRNYYDKEVRDKGYLKILNWFDPTGNSDYANLMLCADVIQKVEKIRLMEGQYRFGDSIMELPKFKVKSMIIESAKKKSKVLHCPLSTIKFLNYPNKTIKNFYIAESDQSFCVYMLKPSRNPRVLNIMAEICGILVDIRYNKEELEEELKQKLIVSSTDLNFLQWPELMNMSAENKLTICFQFYDKISYHTFHTEPNVTIPVFKTSDQFKLVFNDGTKWNGHTQTLTCPMNQINFTTGYSAVTNLQFTSSPFHLTKSINPGCVYKVQMIEKTDNTNILINDDYRFLVSIQAELCGILDPPRTNKYEIQSEFLSAWNATIEQSEVTIPSTEFSTMNAIFQFRLCQNIYKKLFNERLIQNCHGYQYPVSNYPLFFNGTTNIEAYIMRCYPGPRTIKNDLYILESIHLGCVYKLSESDNASFFEITTEICDVYPVNYLLNIQRQVFSPRNFIIDPR